MAESTTLDTLYLVNDSNDDITLKVTVGSQGQTSDMTIKIDDDNVIENHPGNFGPTAVGKNVELQGRTLRIVATIADTSQQTDHTELSITIFGGVLTHEYPPLSKTVDEQGASVNYLCLIKFFKPQLN